MKNFNILFSLLLFILFITDIIFPQWVQQNSGTTKGLYTIHFLNEEIGWIAGEDGTILKTTNSGDNWFSQSISTPDNIRSIFFTDSLNGWIALYDWMPFRHGSIYHSTDGGNTWYVQLSIIDYGLLSLFFIDSMQGWVVGTNGIAYKTTNGGNFWQLINTNTNFGWLYSVRFTNMNVGWAVGDVFGQLPKTTDGGNYWFMQYIPTFNYLIDVYCLDQNFVWAVGQAGVIVKTTNGGINWLTSQSGVVDELRDIHFIDQNNGWVAGFGGKILHTYNGGNSWIQQSSYSETDFYAISFIDELTGWVVGNNGTILETNNGGIPVELTSFTIDKTNEGALLNWTTTSELNNQGFEIQRASINDDFFTIAFIQGKGTTTKINEYTYLDELEYRGSELFRYRLKQIDFDGSFDYSEVIEVDFDIPKDYRLFQNYPNPFNPSTTIKYTIPRYSPVKIIVYDLTGQIIKVLVDEARQPGTYFITFDSDNLSSGIYIYQIVAGDYFSIKKMNLLK